MMSANIKNHNVGFPDIHAKTQHAKTQWVLFGEKKVSMVL
jgi:hypothetical protein